jgi:hypothetical protein
MASKAEKIFDKSAKDVARLMEIHTALGGDKVGRRHRLEVLNKSAIVLITAIWEAFCEDLAAEALDSLVQYAPNATAVPQDLKKQIAAELKQQANQLAVWEIADGGWRQVLQTRLLVLQVERNRKLNTPKSDNIDQLFEAALGMSAISACWKWHKMTGAQSRAKLDKFVSLRGDIAHRGQAMASCTKKQVTSYLSHIESLVPLTGAKVSGYVEAITGHALG